MMSRIPIPPPRGRRSGLLAPLLLLLLLSAAAASAATGAVPLIANGSEPENGLVPMELEELWRVGGEDDEDVLLGIIARAMVDDQDNIYLLDQQLSEVQVYSADGEHLQTLGREGNGPGEVTGPGDFVFMPDGTLGLVQIFPGKIVKLNLDGTPAGEFNPDTGEATTGGFLALINCRSAGGNLALSGIQISMDTANATQTRDFFVRTYEMDGSLRSNVYGLQREWNFAAGFEFSEAGNDFIWWRMDVGPDGRIVLAQPRYGYELSVYDANGNLERVITREYESWERSPEMYERWKTIMEAQAQQFPPGTPIKVEKKEMDITDLRIARDGSIWTLPSRQMYEPEPGYYAVYDVFTPEGRFDRQVGVRCEGDPSRDRLILTGGDRVFMVTGFWDAALGAMGASAGDEEEEPEPMEVICYRVK